MINHLRIVPPIRDLLYQCAKNRKAYLIGRLFQPKVRVLFERNGFLIKTVDSAAELEQVMRLRYEVFHREYQNKLFPFGFDSDSYDLTADHLAIMNLAERRIVGTYRLISNTYSRSFYSQTEFNLEPFLVLPGNKLELSRACVHRDFRKGVVMNLLWRGLVRYIQEVKADYLFGCASVKTIDPSQVGMVSHYLESLGHTTDRYQIAPLPNHVMRDPKGCSAAGDEALAKVLIPALLNSYLRAGAKVCPIPALDLEFGCVDFFTVLNMRELTQIYERKYATGE